MLVFIGGQCGHSRTELQKSVELEPDHANAHGYLGYVLLLLGDFEGARRHFSEQVRLGNEFGNPRLVHIEVLIGDIGKARIILQQINGIVPTETARIERFLDALEDADKIDAYVDTLPIDGEYRWHALLELYMLGEYAVALEQQSRLSEPPREVWAEFWAEARNLPQFMDLISTENIDDVWDELGPPPVCRNVGDGYDCSVE